MKSATMLAFFTRTPGSKKELTPAGKSNSGIKVNVNAKENVHEGIKKRVEVATQGNDSPSTPVEVSEMNIHLECRRG